MNKARQPYIAKRLIDYLEERINSGQFPSGYKIPSLRSLSEQFEIDIGAVRRAIDYLASNSLIEKRPGSGNYVQGKSGCRRKAKAGGGRIAALLADVAGLMLKNVTPENDWNFLQADGSPDPRGICKMWGEVYPHEAARLPMIYAAAWEVTGDGKWKELYERYIDKALEMAAQVNAEATHVSALAAFGYELNFIAADRALAERGCSFLVVHAPDKALAARVAAIVVAGPAVAARHYGRFTIEELIAPPAGETEVSRSPAENLTVHAAAEPSARKPNP